MSEVNTPRLMAAAKEFNIGTNTLIDFLVQNGITEELKPTTKLTETMYRILQSGFQQDKVAHEKAMQIDLPKGAGANDIKKKKWQRVLFVPTGALLSTVSYNEGKSVPGIAHAVMLEHCN